MHFPVPAVIRLFNKIACRPAIAAALAVATSFAAHSQAPAPPGDQAPDELVLINGDVLHGKLVNETAGKVTFHDDPLGDITISSDKIKELHTSQKFGVIGKNVQLSGRTKTGEIPVGKLEIADQTVTLQPENTASTVTIPVKDAQYILDQATLDKYIRHTQGFFEGWNGPATAGASLVTATQNQYTVSGAISLVRVSPPVAWLTTRDRTSIDFNGAFGKTTQPGYVIPAVGATPAATIAPVSTKTAIYHADAERDEYFSPHFFALGQTAFDHNYSQDLNLQQIYGGGIGWTAIKKPKQELDVKATVQYEKQQFITGVAGSNQNLVGSTFSATYALHSKLFNYSQGLSFIPAYNNEAAYSANENSSLAFPAYKNLSFSLGALDSYLNDPPATLPPTKRNSFEFTMGLTYAIKSKY